MTGSTCKPLPRHWQATFAKAGTPYIDEPSEVLPKCDEGWYVVCGYGEEDPRWDGVEHIVLRVEGETDPDDGSVAQRVAAGLRGVDQDEDYDVMESIG